MSELTSKIAIGTAQFGMSYGIANKNGQVSADEVAAILDSAERNGINTIDTAKAYGTSEKSIGDYLKQRPDSKWTIITKISDTDKTVLHQLKDSINKLTVCPLVMHCPT